jgi:glutathione synthase
VPRSRWRASRPPATTAATSPPAPPAWARPLNDRDRWLAGQIGPKLAERGMLFVGLDVIGGFVTEINVTSPTGVREIDKQCGTDEPDALGRRTAA